MATVKQTIPTGKVVLTFIPTEDFFCKTMQSQYVKDSTYYLRAGNDKLAAKVGEWLEAGMIRKGA